MAETKRMTAEQVVAYLLEGGGLDFLRESLRWVVQQLIEARVSELIGAEHGERTPERLTQRNGYRSRRWDHARRRDRARDPEAAPRQLLPELPRAAPAVGAGVVSVIQQAYVCGVSTRTVDQLVESLGLRASRSEVSRICAGLDDAKFDQVRDGGRVFGKCLVIAHGVHESGRREVIGLDCGECETEARGGAVVRCHRLDERHPAAAR